MNIAYRLDWEPIIGAQDYTITRLDASGVESTLAEHVAATIYDTTVDDTQDAVFYVRPFDGVGFGSALEIVYTHEPTLADLRLQVRTALNDLGARQKWPDTEIDQYLRDAINDYGRLFPRDADLTLTARAGVREYVLPSELVSISRVEYLNRDNTRYVLKYKAFKAGDIVPSAETASTYWKLGVGITIGGRASRYSGHYDYRRGVLTLDFDPRDDETLIVRYTGRYTAPPFPTARIDVPIEDHEMLTLYACGKATVRVEGQDANLSRWDESSGRRDDNPLVPMTNRYFNAYQQKVKDKQNRPRFGRRVRV